MPRPIQAIVHPSALAHNLQQIRNRAGDSQIWAVIKANAYGHGIERVFDALRAADGFAVLELTEAQRVRALGWRGPVLLLEGAFEPRDLELCSRLHLWHVVHTEEQIDWLAAHKTHEPHRVFLKMNSGMNRLGFEPAAFRAAWARLDALPQVAEISLMTHFSDADGLRLGADGVAHQMAVFTQATNDLSGERTLANSAATLRHHAGSDVCGDWVRAGIVLYGGGPDYPEHSPQSWDLLPAMSLRTRLIATQTLKPGDTVGYGSTFTAPQAMRIGVAACGYADGYPRHARSGQDGDFTPVLVDGVRTRLVGRVSMDMVTVDLGPVDAQRALAGEDPVAVGAEVVLWGCSSGGHVLPVDEVAVSAGTISWELLCAVAPRVSMGVDEND